jgi:hypothetical protein
MPNHLSLLTFWPLHGNFSLCQKMRKIEALTKIIGI